MSKVSIIIFVNLKCIYLFKYAITIFQRAVEKMVFCPAKGAISDCPYLSKYLPVDNVPTFLGGKCNCPGGKNMYVHYSIIKPYKMPLRYT
jgi:hypothetical protein